MGKRYTIPNRIDDIIALIQVLAFANNSLRTEGGLIADLGIPRSAKTWEEISRLHSEFFRFSEGNKYPFSLIARYTMPKISNCDLQHNSRSPIPNDLVKELLNLAVILHDKEMRRYEHWKIWSPPLIAGLISALIAIFITLNRPSKTEEYLKYKIDSVENQLKEIRVVLTHNIPADSIVWTNKKKD